MTNATSELLGFEELQPGPCDGTGTDAMSKRFHKWHLDVPLEEVILDPTQPVDLATLVPVPCSECPNDPITKRMFSKWKLCVSSAAAVQAAVQQVLIPDVPLEEVILDPTQPIDLAALVPVPCSECPNDPITKRMLAKWKLCDSSASKTATAVQAVEEPLPTVLLVAEKRQMAMDIAEKLSPEGRYRTLVKPPAKKGDRTLEVFTFEGPFSAGHVQHANFKVVATHGHLYHSDFTDLDVRIGSSATFDSADLAFNGHIDKYVPPEKRTSPATKNRRDQPTVDNRVTDSAVHELLRKESVGCDFVVLFLDCDLAGEHICFQVIDLIEGYINVPQGYNINDRTFRAIYSTVNDIEKAMADLKKPNRKYADAVEAKKIIDLRCVGIGRFITAHIREALADEYTVDFLHYGPCIAPILALIVRRFKADRAAQKVARKYWRVTWTVERNGHTLELSSDFDQQPNKHVLAKLVDTTCYVSVEESEQSREPPKALDTVTMMAEASEQLKMQPKDAMKAAQALYEVKLITYPRTDTNVFPGNFDFCKTAEASIASCLKDIMQSQDGCVPDLQDVKEHIRWCAANAEKRYSSVPAACDRFDRPFAHPPIVPTCNKRNDCPSGHLKSVYQMITRHYLASISDPMICASKTATMNVGGALYTAIYKKVVAEGFTRYMPQAEKSVNHSEFESAVDGKYKLRDFRMQELDAELPGLLTISELVRDMGNYCLGTAGTIAEHIEKLVWEYEYVQVKDGRSLYPLLKGVKLVELLERYAPQLASPEYRQKIHRQLNEVANGTKSKDEVVDHVINDIYHAHYEKLKERLRAADTEQFKEWRFRPKQGDHSGEASSSGSAVKP